MDDVEGEETVKEIPLPALWIRQACNAQDPMSSCHHYLFFMRVMGMITQTTNITAMQLMAPDHLRGRVMSLRVFTMGLSPIGVMFMGALSEPSVLGIQNAVMLGGIVYAFVGVVLFGFMPSLRKFE